MLGIWIKKLASLCPGRRKFSSFNWLLWQKKISSYIILLWMCVYMCMYVWNCTCLCNVGCERKCRVGFRRKMKGSHANVENSWKGSNGDKKVENHWTIHSIWLVKCTIITRINLNVYKQATPMSNQISPYFTRTILLKAYP